MRKKIHTRHRSDNLIDGINIIPFLDILLVLMITFMITAPMFVGGIDVELPNGKNPIESKEGDYINVGIKSNGSIYIENEQIQLTELPKKLLTKSKNKVNKLILVKGDVSVEYGKIMELVNVINNSGFTKVVFVTENQ